jgi:hypothetical protein
MRTTFTLAIAAAGALAALPAGPAAAKKTFTPLTAAVSSSEAHSIAKAATGLGRMTSPAARLSLARDRRVDVASLRTVKVARRGASKRLRAVMASDKTVDARVLLLAGTGTEPTYTWWKSMLTSEGVPFDAVVTRDSAPITAASLRRTATAGRYESIVLATGSLTDCSVSPCADTMGPEAWTALQAYEKEFAVREIGGYGWPSPAYGTEWGGDCGNKSEMTFTVTAAGAATFGDLAGSVPTDKGVWGCEMTPLAGSSFQTLVSGPKGAVVGTFTRTDGVETMFNSIDGSDRTIHSRLLFHGMLKWVTKGIYLGAYRNYVGVDVDDVFLSNDRWDPATKALNTDETTAVRMTPADVQRAVAWEATSGISLNLLFNAAGSETAVAPIVEPPTAKTPQAKAKALLALIQQLLNKGKKNAAPVDPLTTALLASKQAFRWTSHTFSHTNLDAATQAEIVDELNQNIAFATKNVLPGFNKTELTTGQHSGLTNPAMAPALNQVGIKSIGSDASRGMTPAALGAATTLPRYPTGIYYNVGTKAEQLDEYNYLNYTLCGTGPACLTAPATWDTYVGNEATMILRHVLGNDPRPHYIHQSNLAEEGTAYPVFDEVLRRYRSYLKVPVVQLSYTDANATLAQQAAWTAALAAGKVSATISATGMSIANTVPNLVAPVTGPRSVPTYGTQRSGWLRLGAGTTQLGL